MEDFYANATQIVDPIETRFEHVPVGVPDYDKFKTSTTGWLLSPDPLCTTVY